MGNKSNASYMVNNEMELINMNIFLGNEGYALGQDRKELLSKIAQIEEKIRAKVARLNKKNGIVMMMLSPNKGRA